MFFRKIGFFPSGQHLVGINLVGHIEDHFILRRLKYIVHGDGRLDDSEVGTEMSAMDAGTL